jgi:hypothetical protein
VDERVAGRLPAPFEVSQGSPPCLPIAELKAESRLLGIEAVRDDVVVDVASLARCRAGAA